MVCANPTRIENVHYTERREELAHSESKSIVEASPRVLASGGRFISDNDTAEEKRNFS